MYLRSGIHSIDFLFYIILLHIIFLQSSIRSGDFAIRTAPLSLTVCIDVLTASRANIPIKPHSYFWMKSSLLHQEFVCGSGWGDSTVAAFVAHHFTPKITPIIPATVNTKYIAQITSELNLPSHQSFMCP